jgi:hypothetical protein
VGRTKIDHYLLKLAFVLTGELKNEGQTTTFDLGSTLSFYQSLQSDLNILKAIKIITKMKQAIIILLSSIVLFGDSCGINAEHTAPTVSEIPGMASSLSQEEIKGLDSVQIDFQFRGQCYAYSSDLNKEPDNGEYHSNNLPQKISPSFPRNGLYLTINQHEYTRLDSIFLGCKLYLVNTTDSLVTLKASDSRLYIVAEALNHKNKWTPISYLQSSFCGNSRHTVKLDKDEYWNFGIPIFKGEIKTKLRYVLLLDKNKKIISNEIVAYLNSGQFDEERKQGQVNKNLMNPY